MPGFFCLCFRLCYRCITTKSVLLPLNSEKPGPHARWYASPNAASNCYSHYFLMGFMHAFRPCICHPTIRSMLNTSRFAL